MLILISDQFYPQFLDELVQFGEVTIDKERYVDADIIIVRSSTKIDSLYLSNAKKLKLVIRGGVGLDNIDLEQANKLEIKVCI